MLEDLRATTGLQAGFLACFYLNLHAPAEAMGVLREAISQRHAVVPFLGLISLFPRLQQDPALAAVLREAGIPVR